MELMLKLMFILLIYLQHTSGKPVGIRSLDFEDCDHDINNTLTHEAYWILYAVNTRATLSPESCDGKYCPFKSYEGLGFSADLMVNQTLPAIRGTLYWRVKNTFDTLVMCFEVPVSIVL